MHGVSLWVLASDVKRFQLYSSERHFFPNCGGRFLAIDIMRHAIWWTIADSLGCATFALHALLNRRLKPQSSPEPMSVETENQLVTERRSATRRRGSSHAQCGPLSTPSQGRT